MRQKAYVSQIGRGSEYKSLEPVYALNLINQNFARHTDEYYHHYRIVHPNNPDDILEGWEFVFVELPKFKARNLRDMRMQVLWLRFVTEIQDQTDVIPKELADTPATAEAVEYLRESAFSKDELYGYDRYWDAISSERTLMSAALAEGLEKGHIQGREEGREEGRAEGERKATHELARRLRQNGLDDASISAITGLSGDDLANL